MNPPINWLLEGEPFIAYRTRLDLLGQTEDDPAVLAARSGMLADPKVQSIISELQDWPWQVISSHKSAGQPFHKLTFLADLGVHADDPGMAPIVQQILDSQSEEGPFQLPINVPTHFGGSGEDQLGWALCDAPLLLYALAKDGHAGTPGSEKISRFPGWSRAGKRLAVRGVEIAREFPRTRTEG